MCLITFAWREDADYPLVLTANRDEQHARPSAPMEWWQDHEQVLGGRDLQAGGTWLALSSDGAFATVTNFRENSQPAGKASRGELVSRFVQGDLSPSTYAEGVNGADYSGFCALMMRADELLYFSNRDGDSRQLTAGTYGLSNATLDTPWPKLLRTRAALQACIADGSVTLDQLLAIMGDRQPATDEEGAAPLPFTMARELSAPFIVTPDYGTRCSTALLYRADGHVEVAERRFDANGATTGESRFVFRKDDAPGDP